MIRLLSLLFTMLLASPALAGEVTAYTLDSGKVIGVYNGAVIDGDAQRLNIFLLMNPDVEDLVMNSPGGSAQEGYRLGEVISNNKLKVWILPGGACISACATAFMGGAEYHIHGSLAFHVAYITEGADLGNTTPSGLLHAGQLEGAREVVYTMRNGFTSMFSMYVVMLTAQDKFMVFHNTDDFLRFYVRNDTEGEQDLAENYYINPIPSGEFVQWVSEHIKTGAEIFEYMRIQRGDPDNG